MILQVSLRFIYDWTLVTRIFYRITTVQWRRVGCEGALPSKLFSTNLTGKFPQFQMSNLNVNLQTSPIHIRFWACCAEKLLQNLVVDDRIVSLQLLIGWAEVIANVALKYLLNHCLGVISLLMSFQMAPFRKLFLANIAGRFPLCVLLNVTFKRRLSCHYFLALVTREPFVFEFCSGLG